MSMLKGIITSVTFEPDLGKFCYAVNIKFPPDTAEPSLYRLFESTFDPLFEGDEFEVSEHRLGEYLNQMHYVFHVEGIAIEKRNARKTANSTTSEVEQNNPSG
jgi:hypothetical protein